MTAQLVLALALEYTTYAHASSRPITLPWALDTLRLCLAKLLECQKAFFGPPKVFLNDTVVFDKKSGNYFGYTKKLNKST